MIKFGYKVKYLDINNKKASVVVAGNEREAIANSGVAKNRIISTNFELVFDFPLRLETQLLILNRMSGALVSGQQIRTFVTEIVNDFPDLNNQNLQIEKALHSGVTLSKILVVMKIHPICCSLVSNGEIAGDIERSIKDAISFLRIEKEVRADSSGKLVGNAFLFLSGLAVLLFLPIIFTEVLRSLEEGDLRVNLNLASHVIYFFGDYNIQVLVLLIVISVLAFYTSDKWFKYVSNFYPFSVFRKIKETKDSIVFVSIFLPLYRSGITNDVILKNYSDISINNADIIRKKVNTGLSISDAIQFVSFSRTFKQSFLGFSKIDNVEAKLSLVEDLFYLLREEIRIYNSQSGIFIETITYVLIIFTLTIMIVGYFLPYLTSAAG